MYQSHPNRDTLFAGNPTNLVTATQNIQSIRFDDLLEMRQVVWDLADYIAEWRPDLIPFFATGGIPYLIPVMDIFRQQGKREFIDGNHFHLFPGLCWGGSIEGTDSKVFFTSRFGEVIRSNQRGEPLRVLVIDTTNSGNAINNAVTACQMAVEASGVSWDSISLRLIGVVNSKHKEAKRPSPDKTLVAGANRTVHVFTPSGYAPSSALVDRQFAIFSPLEPSSGFTFEVAYWLAGNIPTEDNAELIGVEAIHELLDTSSEPRAGRLQIIYGNGESQQGTSLGNLCGQLTSLLSMRLDEMPWQKMQSIHDLPPMTVEERKSLAEIKQFSDGGLRLFELMSMDRIEACAELAKLPSLLMDVEVYWLGTLDPTPRGTASKVLASMKKGRCNCGEAVKYFRRAFGELSSADPGGDASPEWWAAKIDSMPKEAFVDSEQLFTSENELSRWFAFDCDIEDKSWDDLALDFVVIVGSVEEARTLLSDLKSTEMSLEEIQKHLDRTWPVTADKALKFTGPTNEQVAMNFILDCGGWDEATSCLERWIAKDSGGIPCKSSSSTAGNQSPVA